MSEEKKSQQKPPEQKPAPQKPAPQKPKPPKNVHVMEDKVEREKRVKKD